MKPGVISIWGKERGGGSSWSKGVYASGDATSILKPSALMKEVQYGSLNMLVTRKCKLPLWGIICPREAYLLAQSGLYQTFPHGSRMFRGCFKIKVAPPETCTPLSGSAKMSVRPSDWRIFRIHGKGANLNDGWPLTHTHTLAGATRISPIIEEILETLNSPRICWSITFASCKIAVEGKGRVW